jgi:hypothetical protein
MAHETTCPQCGAGYDSKSDSCTARWHALLALDHSRQAPWGPLHGLAFATYSLQHPEGSAPRVLGRAWESLERIIGRGEDVDAVFEEFRAHPDTPAAASAHLRADLAPARYEVTIADLGDFDGETYESKLRAWARATYEAWQAAFSRRSDSRAADRARNGL